MAQLVKNACNAGDLGSIPGWGRSPKGGHSYPLQYSCLENPMTEETGGLQSMGSHQRVRPQHEPALHPASPHPQANSSLLSPAPHGSRGIHWGARATLTQDTSIPQGSAAPTLKSPLLAAHILPSTPQGSSRRPRLVMSTEVRLPRGPTTPRPRTLPWRLICLARSPRSLGLVAAAPSAG